MKKYFWINLLQKCQTKHVNKIELLFWGYDTGKHRTNTKCRLAPRLGLTYARTITIILILSNRQPPFVLFFLHCHWTWQWHFIMYIMGSECSIILINSSFCCFFMKHSHPYKIKLTEHSPYMICDLRLWLSCAKEGWAIHSPIIPR